MRDGVSLKACVLMIVLLCFVYVGHVNAAGFALYEWGARGTSMGGTMIGRADDPSAVAYNPAGITQLEGIQAKAGFSVVSPTGRIQTPEGSKSITRNHWIPPYAYLTWQMNDKAWLGLGIYNRFGLGTEYDKDWFGRYNSQYTRVQSLSFNPNIAYKLTDTLSIAVGAEIMWFDFHQERAINDWARGMRAADIDAKLDGDSYGFGGNVALHYKPNDTWAFGLTYKSRVKQSISGDAKFSRHPGAAAVPQPWFQNTSAKGDITLPDSFALGVTFSPMDRLSLEGNAIYTLWSTYDELKINFGQDLTPGSPLGSTTTSSTDKKWKDVWRFQLGAEYELTDLINVRLGYVYDQIPDRDRYADYMTPTNNRHIITTGLGFKWEKASLDLSYSYLWFANRSIDERYLDDGVLDSRFKNGRTHLTGISFSYRF